MPITKKPVLEVITEQMEETIKELEALRNIETRETPEIVRLRGKLDGLMAVLRRMIIPSEQIGEVSKSLCRIKGLYGGTEMYLPAPFLMAIDPPKQGEYFPAFIQGGVNGR